MPSRVANQVNYNQTQDEAGIFSKRKNEMKKRLIPATYEMFIDTLQNKEIFFLWFKGMDLSDLQIIMSGWIPILLSSLTEC